MQVRKLSWNTLSIGGALALLLCNFVKYIDPIYFPFSFLAGLVFPFVLILFSIILLINLLQKNKIAWWMLITLLLCYKGVFATFGTNFSNKKNKEGVKLMSYNVKNFDLYNWTGNKKTRQQIFDFIKAENPDIINFQEFYSDENEHNNIQYIKDSLGYTYYHFQQSHHAIDKHLKTKNNLYWGIATFSKFPIKNKVAVPFTNNSNNTCIYSDIELFDKKVRVYNMHLQSIHLGYEDYNTLEELAENQTTQWFRLKNILRKIKKAATLRSSQAKTVQSSIAQSPYPVCVSGDFNDVPVSYTYQKIATGLQDAFRKKGFGFGSTFTNKLSFYRIDHALFSKEFKILSYEKIENSLSDHYPILIQFKENN